MKGKISLIQINYTEDHSEKVLPLGILAVGSNLKRHGFEVELININEKEIDKTAEQLSLQSQIYVGLSVMTGIQTKHSAQLSQKIKAINPNIQIVWGGIHPSLLPEQCLAEPYIDYVVISEGEVTSVELAESLINKTDLSAVLGIGYKDGGEIKITPWRPFIANLDEYRLDFSLVDLEKFIFPLSDHKRVIAYKASRGCPFNCSFCYNNAFNQNKWRTWTADVVIEDIKWLKDNYRIDAIKFYDDNFFVDKNRAFYILERIDLPSHLEIRIDSITDEVAEKLKRLKVFDMLIGIESGSNRMLELIDKRFSVDTLMNGVSVIAKHQLPATYSVIVGLPTEVKSEFEATIDLLYKIYQVHPQAAFTLGAYLPYPGSKMYDLAIAEGFKPPVKTEDWGKIDRFRQDFDSPWVDSAKVWRIREYFKFLNWRLGPVIKWFEFRIKHRLFDWPVDIYLVEYFSGLALEQKGFIGKTLRKIYNLFKNNK